MSNIPEEVGKGVATITNALQGNPLCITAVVLSALFCILVYFALAAERQQSHERELAIIRQCLAPVQTQPAPETVAREPRFGGPR